MKAKIIMKNIGFVFATLGLFFVFSLYVNGEVKKTNQNNGNPMYKELTDIEKYVILDKGTERAFSGQYDKFFKTGVYKCKQCGTPLYLSNDKFNSSCGWPSFDDAIPGAVKQQLDKDSQRTEIICNNCGGHLGHVFFGENFTDKNTRHCVNSISMEFEELEKSMDIKTATFASGCFWGVEYHFNKIPGVLSAKSGYTGGNVDNPSYEEVCRGNTGHVEAVKIVYDATVVDYETLAKLYFETHDIEQIGGQGPDIGDQYRSVLFYTDDKQKEIAEKLIDILKNKGFKVATELKKAETFWEAEAYHQDYYDKKGSKPYCHFYTKKF